ncbi:TonB-dependent receptor domain-containing protein [Acetobacter pasteurianus]|uniref:Hemin receptor n=1 Tax=Acetobacter pasteurianus subsp. pasteurianus TaxID=481145 RepID=A0AAC9SUG3_ACEPA|nr:TonB-dependent receptor [Acetobacter pasteurianus]ASC06884.1 Hemin receptor [Acetobacter pasteurianus subsp. pasteurianus]
MSSTHVCAHTFHRAHLLSAAAIFLIPSFAAHANELPGKELENAASTRQAAIKKTPEQSSRNTSKQLGAHVRTGAAIPISSNAAERLVVTATRTPQRIQDVPASVSLITRQDIERRMSSTLADVINRLPDADMAGGARTEGQIPEIRGFNGRDIILLVDGARRNADNGFAGFQTPLYIDPAFVQSVEVVMGAASTLYGSGSMGGVMSIKTLEAKDLLAPGRKWGAELDGGYQSANENAKGAAKVYGKWGKFDGLLAYAGQSFGPISLGGGQKLSPNNGTSNSALLKLGYDITDRIRVDFGQSFYYIENYRPANAQAQKFTVYNLSTKTYIPYYRQTGTRQDDSNIHLTTKDSHGKEDGRLTLYRSKMTSWYGPFIKTSIVGETQTLETYGADIQKIFRENFGYLGSHMFVVGANYYRDINHTLQKNGQGGGTIPDGQQQVYGFYGSDEIKLPYGIVLTPSLRYDRYNTFGSGSSTSTSGAILPKITLAWHPNRNWMVYLSWGKNYRAPTIQETNMNYTITPNIYYFLPNNNLRPESARTYEGGFSYNKSGLFSRKDHALVRATGFYEDATNLIQLSVVGHHWSPLYKRNEINYQYTNIQHATRYGIELRATYNIENINLGVSYSHLRVRDANTGANLLAQPDKVAADASYTFPKIGLTATYNLTAVEAQDYDSTIARRRPGYMLHDILFDWQMPGKPWRVNFAVTNLTNKTYYMYKSIASNNDVPEIGRSVRFNISYKF